MREKITIYSPSQEAPDYDSASFLETLDEVCSVWSKVVTKKGDKVFDEVNLDGEVDTEQTAYVFTIRYRPDPVNPGPEINARYIILWDSQYFRIKTVEDPDKRKRFLMLKSILLGDASVEVNI